MLQLKTGSTALSVWMFVCFVMTAGFDSGATSSKQVFPQRQCRLSGDKEQRNGDGVATQGLKIRNVVVA